MANVIRSMRIPITNSDGSISSRDVEFGTDVNKVTKGSENLGTYLNNLDEKVENIKNNSGKSNWNENDETAGTYIQNKPKINNINLTENSTSTTLGIQWIGTSAEYQEQKDSILDGTEVIITDDNVYIQDYDTEHEISKVKAEDILYDNSTTKLIAENMQSALDEVFHSVSNGKNLIADAITDKGVETSALDTFATMAQHISEIAGNSSDEDKPIQYDVYYGDEPTPLYTNKTFTVEYSGTFRGVLSNWSGSYITVQKNGVNVNSIYSMNRASWARWQYYEFEVEEGDILTFFDQNSGGYSVSVAWFIDGGKNGNVITDIDTTVYDCWRSTTVLDNAYQAFTADKKTAKLVDYDPTNREFTLLYDCVLFATYENNHSSSYTAPYTVYKNEEVLESDEVPKDSAINKTYLDLKAGDKIKIHKDSNHGWLYIYSFLFVAKMNSVIENGKNLIASAITQKGVETAPTDDFETMAENIKNISNFHQAIFMYTSRTVGFLQFDKDIRKDLEIVKRVANDTTTLEMTKAGKYKLTSIVAYNTTDTTVGNMRLYINGAVVDNYETHRYPWPYSKTIDLNVGDRIRMESNSGTGMLCSFIIELL